MGMMVLHQSMNHHLRTAITSTSSSSSVTPRPAVILPGLGNNSRDYHRLATSLKEYGVPSIIVQVSRPDWLRNASGLIDANYWKGELRPRPILDWYLQRVDQAVSEAKLLAEGESVSLLGHSAGGWLARVYMEEFGKSYISLLLTLGSPHLPPPKGIPGVIDQTRGLLNYVEKTCSRAVYTPRMKYVCIAGRYIQGASFFGNSNIPLVEEAPVINDQEMGGRAFLTDINKSAPVTMRARFIGQGYKQVCGRPDVWGDGVVPEFSAHLEGALNVTLEGVYHSPIGSDDVLRPWYGSPAVLEKWTHHLLS